MDMKEEMMNDAIDDAVRNNIAWTKILIDLKVEEEDDEEESDQIVQQVLDEIGISFEQSLPSTSNTITTKVAEEVSNGGGIAVEENSEDAMLQARLDSLRKWHARTIQQFTSTYTQLSIGSCHCLDIIIVL